MKLGVSHQCTIKHSILSSGLFCASYSVQDALSEERPDLLHLLREKLLPTLLAALEPLEPVQIAAIAGTELKQVRGDVQ